ncbi:hypothetical protein LSI54_09080 [Nesterenkonia sp. AY15]|uniref:hypothetical protein n=1 Tax=Nesterenkonia sp. AY15 TaxID=2901139 RepID=UPI001F4C6DF5|nr:hypothetical protein [Nesterenkonia sp. AY15]MCH8571503.1 hypothetical protein [Nesterenkonia sp. AY15]
MEQNTAEKPSSQENADDQEIAETVEQVACLVVPTPQRQSNVRLTTSDVFQDGVKVNPRLTIIDADGHDVWLDLPAEDIEAIGEWLTLKAQEMQDGAL